jgi:hypothetical protein
VNPDELFPTPKASVTPAQRNALGSRHKKHFERYKRDSWAFNIQNPVSSTRFRICCWMEEGLVVQRAHEPAG